MTSDEFLRWSMDRPEGERYELVAGEVVAMAPERSAHALAKLRLARRLSEAIETAGVDCAVYPDGMAIQIDALTTYEPDAFVRCGPPLPDDAIHATDPLIVVEVLSPSSRSRDAGLKLADYFRIASLRHYLIVGTQARTIVHHRRDEDGTIRTSVIRDGRLHLDPPGIDVQGLFPDAAPE